MKLRTILLTVLLLAVMAGAAYYLNRPAPSAPVPEADTTRRTVLDPSVAGQAEKIIVTTDDGKSLTLLRAVDGTWKVPAYFDFPADFSKISSFIDRLSQAHIDRFITRDPARIAHLDFTGAKVQLLGAHDQPLWSMDLGKNNDTGTGRYVRFGGAPDAYLTDLHLWLDAGAQGWAVSKLTDLPANTVTKLSLPFSDGSVLTVVRATPTDPWRRADPADHRPLDGSGIDSIVSVLSSLGFSASTALDDPGYRAARSQFKTYALTTFAGATVSIALGGPPLPKAPASGALQPWFASVTSSDPQMVEGAWRHQRAFQLEEAIRNELPLTEIQIESAPR